MLATACRRKKRVERSALGRGLCCAGWQLCKAPQRTGMMCASRYTFEEWYSAERLLRWRTTSPVLGLQDPLKLAHGQHENLWKRDSVCPLPCPKQTGSCDMGSWTVSTLLVCFGHSDAVASLLRRKLAELPSVRRAARKAASKPAPKRVVLNKLQSLNVSMQNCHQEEHPCSRPAS